MPKALVLFSGGLDSTILLFLTNQMGYDLTTLTIDYGQRNSYELKAANDITRRAKQLQVIRETEIIRATSLFAEGNMLTGEGPSAFVPSRNMVFLALAANRAYVNDHQVIFIGITKPTDQDAPDARKPFINAMQEAMMHGLGREIMIGTPLEPATKAHWLRWASQQPACWDMLRYTYSCYRRMPPCGECNACHLRERAFKEAGLVDPAL
jgi:7-cyano-7-deazaguanine synthase